MTANPNFPENLDIEPYHFQLEAGVADAFDVVSQTEAIKLYGIAGRVWEAAYALMTYIANPPSLEFDPPFLEEDSVSLRPTILELGSGTGIVASCIAERLARTACRIIATDLPEVCSLLEKNLGRYALHSDPTRDSVSAPSILVRPLAWGNERHAVDLFNELESQSPPMRHVQKHEYVTSIVCSDLVYFPELLAPLLRSLLQVTSPPFAPSHGANLYPRLIISYKIRSLSKETPFWSAFGLWFTFEPVLVKHRNPTKDSPETMNDAWSRFGSSENSDTFVFVARRRPESFEWDVPADDQNLLSGVGARRSNHPKNDSTFEELLLMQVEI